VIAPLAVSAAAHASRVDRHDVVLYSVHETDDDTTETISPVVVVVVVGVAVRSVLVLEVYPTRL
jgi:hypothetical protein